MSKLITRISATIAAGDHITGAISIAGLVPSVIEMPAVWDAAVISFLVTGDGANYKSLYKQNGQEVIIPVEARKRVILPSLYLKNHTHMMIRSGTTNNSVDQVAAAIVIIEMWK